MKKLSFGLLFIMFLVPIAVLGAGSSAGASAYL